MSRLDINSSHPSGTDDEAEMLAAIYVMGGQMRRSVFRKLEEWQSCDRARLVRIDCVNQTSTNCIDYVSPPEVCADDTPTIQFKSGFMQGDTLYACTSTEVLVYEVPTFRQVGYVSLPCFNDLHHVCPTPTGTIAVCVTGLDLVVEVTLAGEVVGEWDVLGEATWKKFSRDIDYRTVPTTKPHRSHPNHVFVLDGELWVTRLMQRDAICLTQPGNRIDIAVERPHDGYVFGDSIYFTTVDGRIVLADRQSHLVTQVYDLNTMHPDSNQTLGWCRGVLPIDKRYIWVGFTRVRPTKFVENVAWIKNGASRNKASHIALYDLVEGRCMSEIDLASHGVGVVFSLFSAQP